MESPKLHVIDSEDKLLGALDYLLQHEYAAYDSETTGLHHGCEVIGFSFCCDENNAYYIILDKWDTAQGKLVPVLRGKLLITNILNQLKTMKLLMHNAIFDCTVAENYFKINLIDAVHTDTMVLAHLLNENRKIGLKELAKEYFGEDSTLEAEEMKASVIASGGVWSAKNKEMYKCDSLIMGKYGAKDAWLTYMLFLKLVPDLFVQKLDKFFYEDESMPLLRTATYQLNTTGLKVDIQALTSLKKTLQAECLEAKDFIYAEIRENIKEKYPGTSKKNTFSITSSQQLSWLLFGKLSLEFDHLTDGGKAACKSLSLSMPYTRTAKNHFIAACERLAGTKQFEAILTNGKPVKAKKFKEPWAYIACDKKTLAKIAPKLKWVERLLEYQRKTKILTTYIKGIEQRIQYGIIRPSFLQTGTTSGRYSSRNPNFQNLPRDDKRIKACIVARPGKLFVGADYSQLEPRVFAYYSRDSRLLKAFEGQDDFYSVIGIDTFSITDATPRKEGSSDAFGIKYKKLRDRSKTIALAATYGATAHQLAPTTGLSIDDTQDVIDRYFEAFPGVRQYQLDSHELAKTTGQVTNLFGRPRRMPEASRIAKLYSGLSHSELPYECRNVLNLAVNHRIQSTGASIINRAMIAFTEHCSQAGIDCRIVVQVHDSLVIECNEVDAKNVSLLLQHAMENTIDLKTVKLEAAPKIGKNLSEV